MAARREPHAGRYFLRTYFQLRGYATGRGAILEPAGDGARWLSESLSYLIAAAAFEIMRLRRVAGLAGDRAASVTPHPFVPYLTPSRRSHPGTKRYDMSTIGFSLIQGQHKIPSIIRVRSLIGPLRI